MADRAFRYVGERAYVEGVPFGSWMEPGDCYVSDRALWDGDIDLLAENEALRKALSGVVTAWNDCTSPADLEQYLTPWMARAKHALAGVAAGPQTTPQVLWEGDLGDLCSVDGANPVGSEPGTRVRVVAAPTSQENQAPKAPHPQEMPNDG